MSANDLPQPAKQFDREAVRRRIRAAFHREAKEAQARPSERVRAYFLALREKRAAEPGGGS